MNKKQDITGETRSLSELLSACWDANVRTRAEDLEQGTDISYIHVIKPWILEMVTQLTTPESHILDAGCGCGYLSNAIFQSGRPHVHGVDISTASIEYARKRYPAISFECEDICLYTSEKRYDLCLAVMTLNNLPNLDAFFSSVRGLLSDTGRMILVIPHPRYWPQRHLTNPEYSYSLEKPYEYAFSTKGRADYTSPVLYFHRTLETYFHCIRNGGFQIATLRELWEAPDKPAPDILGMELTLA